MSFKYLLEKTISTWRPEGRVQISGTGWFYTKQKLPATALRIRIGKRIIPCIPVHRPDIVFNLSQLNIGDANIGFRYSFESRSGFKLLRFEAMLANGRWVRFTQKLKWVTKRFTACTQSYSTGKPNYNYKKVLRPTAFDQLPRLSIVMPTYNRASTMAEVVRKTHDLVQNLDYEWVIINDGSSDNTVLVLEELTNEIPNIRYFTVKNGGQGIARNLGASLARNPLVLFVGDDIIPCSEDFLLAHVQLHHANPELNYAVLGKISWPNSDRLDVNSVMRHIQGRSGEQFGYADLSPNTIYDWRFFYTCNISVKKNVVADWLTQGFSSAFKAYGFEDIELAYRIHKNHGGLKIHYTPRSQGQHLHPYTLASFIRRQEYAGAMAYTFINLHAEVRPILGVSALDGIIQNQNSNQSHFANDYLSVIEGIKAWASILEREKHLGNEAWHDELIFAVFEMAYLLGYLSHAAKATTDFEKAYAYIIDRVKTRLGRIMDSELSSDALIKVTLLGQS